MTSYDSWLEAPYQRELEAGDRYEDALETEATAVQAELEALTVKQLLDEHPQFSAKLQDIFMQQQALPIQTYVTYQFSLEECFLALVAEIAEQRLQATPVEYDGPEPDDFDCDCLDFDRDCDYWERTK